MTSQPRMRWGHRWLVALLLGVILLLPHRLLAAPCTYIVQGGDTLATIAARQGTTVGALLQANPSVTNPNVIRVGQSLLLPSCTTEAAAPASVPAPVPSILGVPVTATTLRAVPAAPADLDASRWQRAHDATIMIRHPIKTPTNGGSGIVIGRDGRTFLTAYHVIGDPLTGRQTTRVAIGPFGDWQYTADVIATDPALDLAVLRVNEPDFPGFAVAPLGRSASLASHSPIYTLSYPGFEGALVAGKGHYLMELHTFYNRSPLIVTNAQASFGSSGGVAVNDRGEVIGIITGGVIGARSVERLGYAGLEQVTLLVPIDAASDLLRQAGVR